MRALACRLSVQLAVTAMVLLAAVTTPAQSQEKTWVQPPPLGNWSDPFNWLPLFPFPPTVPSATDNAIIDNGGTAQVVRSANAVARSLILGTTGGGSGTVDVRGTLNIGTSIVLGSSTGSSGTLIVQGGGTLTSVLGAIANAPGSQGSVTVTGPTSTWTNSSSVVVGGQGAGTLTIANGGTVTSGAGGSIGLTGTSTGTVRVTGPGSTWNNGPSGGLNIGSFGTGMLVIENGGVVINTTPVGANIGNAVGSQGMVTVTGSGSTWSNNGGVNIGNSGTGTLTIADGGIVTGTAVVIATTGSATGTLNIGAGAAPGTITAPSVAFGAGTGIINFNHTSASYVFAPAITGNGTVNVLAGATIFNAGNTYSGATNVSSGTLQAGALNTFSPNSAVTVASGGTLDLNGFSQFVPNVTNVGLVSMGTGTGPGTVLTVSNYASAGGKMSLNTYLGTDGSPSDLLVVNGGAATGTTRMSFTDTGGGGALTNGDGIRVVDATNGTTVPRAFGGFAAAGPYEYLLFRGGSTPGSENDWFLRSNLQSGPGPGPNPEPPAPPGPPVPRYRQEVSLYAAMPVLASIYGRHMIDTLHERMGGDAQLLGPVKRDMPDGMWGRIIGYWGHRDGDPIGIYGRSGPAFDYDFGAIQTGLDLYRNEYANGQRDNAGLYVAVGRANADVEHSLLGRTFKGGEDKFTAVTLGGYWTRFGESGWYLDGVLQGTWYDMDMTAARGLREGDTNGFGLAASLEGGYPFHLGNGWLLEPQTQLVYQALNIDDFNDGAADVSYSDTDSLAGRIGARVARDWGVGAVDASGRAPRTFSLWVRGDIWHEFLGDPTTAFSSAAGSIPFTADLGDTSGRLGIGASMQVSDAATVYGNVNYESSFDGDADAWAGKVGFKTTW